MNRTCCLVGAFVLITGAANLSGCRSEVAEKERGTESARPVIVKERPPAEPLEVVTIPPSRSHVWIPGHWEWQTHWVWVRGKWELPPRTGATWVRGEWVESSGGWEWKEGHWSE
jgi:hypothetical protein